MSSIARAACSSGMPRPATTGSAISPTSAANASTVGEPKLARAVQEELSASRSARTISSIIA